MKLRWKDSTLIRSRRIACLELHFSGDERFTARISIVEKTKGELKVTEEREAENDVLLFRKIVPSGIPLFLVLGGKGVLVRKEKTEEGETRESVLQRILPNASADDLIHQLIPSEKGESYVCVSRKSVVEKAVEAAGVLKLSLAHVCLGPTAVMPLLSFIKGEKRITVGKYNCQVRETQLINCTQEENAEAGEMVIEGEKIPFSRLNALGCAQMYFSNEVFHLPEEPLIAEVQDEFLHSRFLKSIGAACLVIIFVILLGNYFLYEKYKKKLDSISGEVAQYDAVFGKLDTLTLNLQEKKNFLERSGLLSPSRLSYYADRMAASMPTEIKLIRMDLQPAELNEDNEEEAIKLKTGSIVITGSTASSIALNNWIRILKNYDWASQVLLLSYLQENLPNPAVFNLEIVLK